MNLRDILLSDDVVLSIHDNILYLLKKIPEIRYMMGFDQKNPQHHLDVWNHTLLALSLSKKDFDVRLSLLLHDIGKPFSYTEGDIRHFDGHAKVSAFMSADILKRLRYRDDYIKYICFLIRHHDMPINDVMINNNFDMVLKLYEIQRCDALAHHPDKLEKRIKYLDKINDKILIKKKSNN